MRVTVGLFLLLGSSVAFSPVGAVEAADGASQSGALQSRTTPWNSAELPGRMGSSDARHEVISEEPARRMQAITAGPLPVAERVAALHEDDSPISQDDYRALTAMVKRGEVPGGLSANHYHYLANEIWNALRAEEGFSQPLAEHLATVANTSSDPVICDYALQHLAQLEAPGVRPIQNDALIAFAENTTSPLAGTALVGLYRLNERSPDPETLAALRRVTYTLAVDPEADTSSRVSAFSLATDLEVSGLLSTARQIVPDSAADPRLRLAAIRYLGVYGETSDATLIEESRHTFRNPFLFEAAREAKNQIGPS
ncbi:hypothetical protein [Puniceicoccus vermicola]|uniref:HEAT repeat domain-containing protein n=1 Tax=Puniceicoccus vermicola TaxID=388746 RepID=A0A7X1AV83_9BACT|nr:hypothetical protein [Puniceicoccus vermicola]MBC2600626.1 hypothetical protein [Puniceicoccus vermicola]